MGRIEKKFYDGVLTEVSIPAAGSVMLWAAAGPSANTTTIVDIAQGTGESQRIGRKCTITNIHIRLNYEFISSGSNDMTEMAEAHETVRFILYWDKQCNGATAAVTDLLDTDVYNSFRNLANGKRFNVLADKLLTFNSTASASGNGTASKSKVIMSNNRRKNFDFSTILTWQNYCHVEGQAYATWQIVHVIKTHCICTCVG